LLYYKTLSYKNTIWFLMKKEIKLYIKILQKDLDENT